MIHGILLEGTDYVGKTSVARALVARLEARGVEVQHNKCYRSNGPLIAELERLAKRDDTVEGRDWLYSAALLVDLALAEPTDRFVIQERHWFSQLARNRFFHPERVMIPEDSLRRLHTPFECQVYLTCDIESKRQRSSGRVAASPRDRVLAGDPATHQAFDEASIALLPADERWLVLDTSHLTVDAIADQILTEMPCAPW